jgi:hypothetical protein
LEERCSSVGIEEDRKQKSLHVYVRARLSASTPISTPTRHEVACILPYLLSTGYSRHKWPKNLSGLLRISLSCKLLLAAGFATTFSRRTSLFLLRLVRVGCCHLLQEGREREGGGETGATPPPFLCLALGAKPALGAGFPEPSAARLLVHNRAF